MSLFKAQDSLGYLSKEIGVSKHFPITHLDSPSIFETQSGALGIVLKCEGVSFDTALDETLNRWHRRLHQAILQLDERFCVWQTLHRRRANFHLSGTFAQGFAKQVNDAYFSHFDADQGYLNDLYVTLIFKGVTAGKAGKGLWFFRKLTDKAVKLARLTLRAQQIKSLKQALSQLEEQLQDFRPHVLGSKDAVLGYSELLSFLGLFVNAGETRQFQFPSEMSVGSVIGHGYKDTDQLMKRYPKGHIGSFLCAKQVLFGEAIQFEGASETERHFGAMLSIKQYGTATASLMFDRLLQLPGECISTHSFAILPKDVALKQMDTQSKKMQSVKDRATSQREALVAAEDLVASEHLTLGYYHHTLMCLAESKALLEKRLNQAMKVYADAGFMAVKETFGLQPAFWSQIPGNFKYIARSALLTSQNFADMAPLHNYRSGYVDNNHLGSAVTILETPSKTPYYFNFHAKGSRYNRQNLTKGHTIIIGGNGSGKTALMTFMDAQLSRYGGQSIFFDRDRGVEIYVRAMNGRYFVLSPDTMGETCFNPLHLPDTAENRQFNRQLLAQCCKEPDETHVPAEIEATLKTVVDYAYDQLAFEHRTLSNACQLLPIDFPRFANLNRFLRGKNGRADGEYAYLFDNATDTLRLGGHMGFDLTHFLDHEPAHVRTALMMYLCHRVDEVLMMGLLLALYFDEGWQNLIDPFWLEKLKRWLPTLRKYNAFIVMSTQSPSTVLESPLRGLFLDNVATEIYFTNPQAKAEEYQTGFHLSEAEYEFIKNNDPISRLFLVKQGQDSTICRLNLREMPKELAVLSGTRQSVGILEKLLQELKNANPGKPLVANDWLPLFFERLNLVSQ